MTPITVQMINERLFDSQARREVWVTPAHVQLPRLRIGLGPGQRRHQSPVASTAATAFTHFVPHLLLCFIA